MNGCAAERARVARGGRLIRWKGQVASLAPSLFLASASIAALIAGGATAQVISDQQTTPLDFSNDEDITITSTGSVELTSGAAPAVTISPDYSSTFTNNGTIVAPIPAISQGTGVFVASQLLPGGRIINNGSIEVISESVNLVVSRGIDFDDVVGGAVINTGDITTGAIRQGGLAVATGLNFADFVVAGASVENSGNITSFAEGSETNNLFALGLAFNEDVTANITNSGSLVATGRDGASVEAIGTQILIGRTLTGNFENSGEIQASVENADSAFAVGTFIQGLMTGDLNNSGSAMAEAEAATSAIATAYSLTADVDGNIHNSGMISARAESPTLATAAGVDIGGQLRGDIRNTSSISAEAVVSAGSGSGTATAVGVNDMQGAFSNEGAIMAAASGPGQGDAFGLRFENFDGVITDVGRVAATATNGNAYAIYLGTGSGTLNIDSRDDVTGLIRVQDHTVNLDAQGGSAVFFFEAAAPGSGAFVTTVSDGRSAWFVDDEGGSDPIYAVIDGADIAASGDIAAYYGSVVGRTVEALRYDPPEQVTQGQAFAGNFGGFRPFAMIDAEFRRFENTPGINTDLTVFNGVAGYSGQAENGLTMAFGLGVFRSDGDTDTTDFDTTGVYLDAAFGRQFGAFTVEGGLGFGWLDTDRSRQVAGNPDAEADFDSTLFTAHIGVERRFELKDTLDLLGFGDVRYTRQEDDSYTETGSVANASVGDTTTEVIEARVGVEARKSLADGGILIGRLSGVVRRDLGDTDAEVTVFSDTQTLSFASTDFTGASLLVGYEHDLPNNMRFEVTAEHEIGDAAQGPNFLAGLSWNF